MSESEVILYGIRNCDQVKKARAWLVDHRVAHRFHDYKKSGADANMLREWLDEIGWEQLLNRKGTTWRGLPEEAKASVADALGAAALMCLHPSLIKRPVLRLPGFLHVGFSAMDYQNIFKV